MIKHFVIIVTILCHTFSAQGAFFYIDKKEKEQMIQCGFYLYLLHNNISCDHVDETLTEEFYEQFLERLKTIYNKNNAPTSDKSWMQQLPPDYQTFENFRTNIMSTCEVGENVCRIIKYNTLNPSRLQRKQCNTLCSRLTCRDMFTLSSCYAMNTFGIEDDDSPICPDDTVKNCLQNVRNLPALLSRRQWPAEWENLEQDWDKIFLATSPEAAKGRALGLRLVEIGGVTATLVALPFIAEALFPGAIVIGGTLARKGIVDLAFAGIKAVKSFAISQVTKQINAGVSTVEKQTTERIVNAEEERTQQQSATTFQF